MLENLTYWNVDKQEAYYSYIEASLQREKEKQLIIPSNGRESKSTGQYFSISFFQEYYLNVL